jgi:hypothetical protein
VNSSTLIGRSTAAMPKLTWRLLLLLGLLLVPLGAVELGTILFPTNFGNLDWEFGTISDLLDRLPLFGIGVCLTLLGSAVLGISWLRWLSAVVLVLVVALLMVFAALYATNVPVMIQVIRTTGTPQRIAIEKAMAKGVAHFVLYVVGFLIITIRGVRLSRPIAK